VKAHCRWKQLLLFRREVDSDLAFKLLLDLRLPGGEINFSRSKCTIKADA
jgi:hypothetical protein